MVNLIEPGDRVVLCVIGFFGQRMVEVASRTGAELTVLQQPWGEVFDLNQIREVLLKVRPKSLGNPVHAETSTGAWQPIEELGKICRETGTAGDRRGDFPRLHPAGRLDDWGVDAAFSCSQKGDSSCPPGLSPVSFRAAVEAARQAARRRCRAGIST